MEHPGLQWPLVLEGDAEQAAVSCEGRTPGARAGFSGRGGPRLVRPTGEQLPLPLSAPVLLPRASFLGAAFPLW